MGRESTVACIPTPFIELSSLAPMENSPPGIQTIPAGIVEGAGTLFSTVGSNPVAALGIAGEFAGAAVVMAVATAVGAVSLCAEPTNFQESRIMAKTSNAALAQR